MICTCSCMHAWGCHLGCGSAGGCVGSPELPVPAHSHHHQQVPQDGHQDNCGDEGEQYDLLCYAKPLTRTWGGGAETRKEKTHQHIRAWGLQSRRLQVSACGLALQQPQNKRQPGISTTILLNGEKKLNV